jgi:hypothetical protein
MTNWYEDGTFLPRGCDDGLDLMPPKKQHRWYDFEVRYAEVVASAFWKHPRVNVRLAMETDRVLLDRSDLEHLLSMLDEVEGKG